MSQQIDRMGVSELRAPCVTPKAFLWNFAEKRPFTGIDKLIFQCFPVDDMKLTCLSETVASQHVYSPKKKVTLNDLNGTCLSHLFCAE